MVESRYFDPAAEVTRSKQIGPGWHVTDLVRAVLNQSSTRGRPAAELTRDDGSSITLATDGESAVLVWVDSLGASHNSVGTEDGDVMIFDHFGAWSEAPSEFQVPLEHAVEAMEHFVLHGEPATNRVIFSSD